MRILKKETYSQALFMFIVVYRSQTVFYSTFVLRCDNVVPQKIKITTSPLLFTLKYYSLPV